MHRSNQNSSLLEITSDYSYPNLDTIFVIIDIAMEDYIRWMIIVVAIIVALIFGVVAYDKWSQLQEHKSNMRVVARLDRLQQQGK